MLEYKLNLSRTKMPNKLTIAKVQKTIYGYNAKKIIKRIRTVKTMGGYTKETVSIPTFSGTISHWTVSRDTDLITLSSSGAVSIILMLS